jgi:CheY-like chemotaxis protein
MRKILLVDDDKDVHLLLETLIQRSFNSEISLNTFHSGQEALDSEGLDLFDIIICDLEMPNGDGNFFFSEFQKLKLQIPFIFFTSRPEDAPNIKNQERCSIVSKLTPRLVIQEIKKFLPGLT